MKLEPVSDLGYDFDREGRVLRQATGYRQHRHMRQWRKVSLFSPRRAPDARDPDGALADDEAGDRLRKRQTDRELGVDVRKFL